MQFDNTLTLEDFREAYAPRIFSRKPQKRTNPLPIFLPIFGCCVFAAYWGDGSRMGPPPPQRSLWLDLIPSIVVIHLLLVVKLNTTLYLKFSRKRVMARPSRLDQLWMVLLVYSPAIWLVPLWVPELNISWNPTNWQVLSAAAAPWVLYAAFVQYRSQWSKKNLWAKLWANHPSMRRPCHFEATDQFLSVDDGEVYRRFQWTYFFRYEETENLLVLIAKEHVRVIIGKRAIADETSLAELRRLISDHIQQGEFLPHKTAFAVVLPVENGDPSS